MRCAILTDFPSRFETTKRVLLGSAKVAYDIERARLVRGAVVLKLQDVSSREDADKLRGQMLYVPDSEAVPLDEGSYFWYQIIGLKVLTVEGEELGQIEEILQTGSNDVYVVRSGKKELLVPAIQDVVREVDLQRGIVTVELMEGLG